MVTITFLTKDERAARVALAATLEPDDAVTGRLIAAVGAGRFSIDRVLGG